MGLFNRKKQATERVQDLKSRVESLRKVDDEHRALTLDDFLQGDDTVTSRSEPRLVSGSSGEAQPSALPDENSLEAELQRYLQRQDGEEADALEPNLDDVEVSDWSFEAPVSDAPQQIRPISIDEFPPLPPPEERYSDEIETDLEPAPSTGTGPLRLSADEEAALIAELQRYVQPEPSEDLEAAPVVSNVLATEDFSWAESPIEVEPVTNAPTWELEVEEMSLAETEELAQEPIQDQEPFDASIPEPETKLMQLEGRSYEEPQPRHWPSVPLSASEDEAPAEPEPARWPRAAGDWEPL